MSFCCCGGVLRCYLIVRRQKQHMASKIHHSSLHQYPKVSLKIIIVYQVITKSNYVLLTNIHVELN